MFSSKEDASSPLGLDTPLCGNSTISGSSQ
jgi:hypothetical protein